MRWQVHGTDAATGRPVTLGVEHAEATGAVQAALSKRILVNYVIGGLGLRMRAWALPVACAAAVLLGATCGVFYWRHAEAQAALHAAQADHARIGQALAKADAAMVLLRNQISSLEQTQVAGGQQLLGDLDAARKQLAATEKDLAVARQQVAELEQVAQAVGGAQADAAAARKQLAAAQDHASSLETQLQQQRKELDFQMHAMAALAKSKQQLAAELDGIKSQLLAQAAKTEIPAISTPAPDNAAASRSERWALRMEYDQAMDFVSLHFSPDKTTTAASAQGTVVTTAVWTANAATLRLEHDAQKQRVYAATLTLSLAPDAPKDKLAENSRLVAAFAKVFAPELVHADAWAADAVKQLAAKDSSERLMRIGADYKVTVWNGGEGMYSWKVESPHGELVD